MIIPTEKLSAFGAVAQMAGDEQVLYVPASNLLALLTFLRDDPQLMFKQLTDVTAVDYPARSPRFDVVYQLLSMHHNRRLRVKVQADEVSPVPSVCGLSRLLAGSSVKYGTCTASALRATQTCAAS